MATARRVKNSPLGVLVYPHLFVPKRIEKEKPASYSLLLIVTPVAIVPLRNLVLEVATEAFGANALEMLKTQQLSTPIRSGDEPRKAGDENYRGQWFFNAYRKEAEGAPDVMKFVGRGERPVPLLDKSEIYSGCLAYVNLDIFSYSNPMKKGVGFGINHVMLVAPGKRIEGGRRDAADALMDDVDMAAVEAAHAAHAEAAAAAAANDAGGPNATPW